MLPKALEKAAFGGGGCLQPGPCLWRMAVRAAVEIAQETGIETQDLDLHSGFNILKYRIFDVIDNPSDLVP